MKYVILYIFFGLGLLLAANAQEKVRQEVKVVKPYEPIIGDAFKISELPKIVDTIKVKPSFEYEIAPVKHSTSFNPTPIKPARLINEPLSKLYYGYAKAGFGSYLSPLAEVYLGSKRSEHWNWNGKIHYNSSNGKIKNSLGDKVYSGLSNTQAAFNSSYYFKSEKTIKAGVDYGNHINYFYGFNPEKVLALGIDAPLLKDEIEHQSLHVVSAYSQLETNYLDSSRVNYQVKVKWQTLSALNGIGEHKLDIATRLDYFFENEFIGADVDLKYINNKGIEDTINAGIFRFSPWVGAFGNKWRIVAGVNTYFDQANENYKFYPRVSMHYNIIDYFLIPYFELGGSYTENSYLDIYAKNPFIKQTLGVRPTDNKINMTFGFRGNISSKVAFNAKIDYNITNNQYFFVNDTSSQLQNKFITVTDTITRVRLLGELSYKTNERLWLAVKGNYYKYTMGSQLKPWHLPTFEFSLNARYRIQNKITLDVNVFGIGTRYARDFDANNQLVAKELQGIVDLNLGVEYRVTKLLSAFAHFNNISSVKYYQWNNYPTQRFNVMLGGTYSF